MEAPLLRSSGGGPRSRGSSRSTRGSDPPGEGGGGDPSHGSPAGGVQLAPLRVPSPSAAATISTAGLTPSTLQAAAVVAAASGVDPTSLDLDAEFARVRRERAQSSLRKAARLVVMANRLSPAAQASINTGAKASPEFSKKGVPLLRTASFRRAIGKAEQPAAGAGGEGDSANNSGASVAAGEAQAGRVAAAAAVPVTLATGGRGAASSPFAPSAFGSSSSAGFSAPDAPPAPPAAPEVISDADLDLAARFVEDALANRSPNVRLAAVTATKPGGSSSSGVTGGAAGTAAGPRAALQSLLSRRVYIYPLIALNLFHCGLAFWEADPRTPLSPPFSWTVGLLELLPLLAYVLDQALTLHAFGTRYYVDKKWERVFAALVVASWCDWGLYYGAGLHAMWRFSRPWRLLLTVTKHHALRRLLASVLRTIPKMLNVSLLLLLVVFFYGNLGVQLFNGEQVAGYNPADDNFNSWPAAVLATFILGTTENYPNVANEAYNHRPYVAAVFFVSALFVLLWVILPLILAIVYNHYKDVHKEMVRRKRIKTYLSLVYAYQTAMGGDGDREMDRTAFGRLVTRVRPLGPEAVDIMFDLLDEDRSGAITVAEFLRLPAVLRLEISPSAAGDEEEGGSGAATYGGYHALPSGPGGTGIHRSLSARLRTSASALVKTRRFYAFSLGVAFLTAVFSSLWTTDAQHAYDQCICAPWDPPPADDDPLPPYRRELSAAGGSVVGVAAFSRWGRVTQEVAELAAWATGSAPPPPFPVSSDPTCTPASGCGLYLVRWSEYAVLVLLLLQVVELGVRMAAHRSAVTAGWGRFWVFASKWNTLDTFVVAWSVASSVALIAGVHESGPPELADVFEASRPFRYLRLLSLLPGLRAVANTVGRIMPLVLSFTVVTAALTYAFALTGVSIFGGGVQPPNTGTCQACQWWTYDTLPRAFLAQLQLLVGNNWNSILYPNLDTLGTRWGAWFFIAYRFLITDVVLNIVEGVMIEAYSKAEDEERKRAEDEALAAKLAAMEAGARRSLLRPPAGGDKAPLATAVSFTSASPPLASPPNVTRESSEALGGVSSGSATGPQRRRRPAAPVEGGDAAAAGAAVVTPTPTPPLASSALSSSPSPSALPPSRGATFSVRLAPEFFDAISEEGGMAQPPSVVKTFVSPRGGVAAGGGAASPVPVPTATAAAAPSGNAATAEADAATLRRALAILSSSPAAGSGGAGSNAAVVSALLAAAAAAGIPLGGDASVTGTGAAATTAAAGPAAALSSSFGAGAGGGGGGGGGVIPQEDLADLERELRRSERELTRSAGSKRRGGLRLLGRRRSASASSSDSAASPEEGEEGGEALL